MTELVFSIQAIFDAQSPAGCLTQYHSECYHVPAYQRGYKWSAEPGGAVNTLLQDLWLAFEAYQRQEKKEYYLQYITVKKGKIVEQDCEQSCLEVIDGQQRLTTLSILLSVLAALLAEPNPSAGKLHYAVRDDVFAEHIYPALALQAFVQRPWSELAAVPKLNKQDVYYLHAAAGHIYQFLEARFKELTTFAAYLRQHVKLIVNAVEAHVPSETVFKNLNSHRVPLSEAELIKALLITRVGRMGAGPERKSFREVLENRIGLGRLWDELSRWANQSAMRTFYFNGYADGLHQLLKLTALYLGGDQRRLTAASPGHDLRLFEFYNQYPAVAELYATLKDVQARLADWYADPATYNLLGYCRFVKRSGYNDLLFLRDCLRCTTRPALRRRLEEVRDGLVPVEATVATLRYGEPGHEEQLHAALLALSVFVTGVKGSPIPFDFHAFVTEKWSLEHIFPQSPEGKDAVLSATQRAAVKDMLGAGLTDELRQLLGQDLRQDGEKQRYYQALQAEGRLNSIGNLCLLTSADNSSNGCLFFAEKRRNVLHLLQRGSFVPKHTFDVFSRMLPPLVSGDPTNWTATDIDRHGEYITQQLHSN